MCSQGWIGCGRGCDIIQAKRPKTTALTRVIGCTNGWCAAVVFGRASHCCFWLSERWARFDVGIGCGGRCCGLHWCAASSLVEVLIAALIAILIDRAVDLDGAHGVNRCISLWCNHLHADVALFIQYAGITLTWATAWTRAAPALATWNRCCGVGIIGCIAIFAVVTAAIAFFHFKLTA